MLRRSRVVWALAEWVWGQKKYGVAPPDTGDFRLACVSDMGINRYVAVSSPQRVGAALLIALTKRQEMSVLVEARHLSFIVSKSNQKGKPPDCVCVCVCLCFDFRSRNPKTDSPVEFPRAHTRAPNAPWSACSAWLRGPCGG